MSSKHSYETIVMLNDILLKELSEKNSKIENLEEQLKTAKKEIEELEEKREEESVGSLMMLCREKAKREQLEEKYYKKKASNEKLRKELEKERMDGAAEKKKLKDALKMAQKEIKHLEEQRDEQFEEHKEALEKIKLLKMTLEDKVENVITKVYTELDSEKASKVEMEDFYKEKVEKARLEFNELFDDHLKQLSIAFEEKKELEEELRIAKETMEDEQYKFESREEEMIEEYQVLEQRNEKLKLELELEKSRALLQIGSTENEIRELQTSNNETIRFLANIKASVYNVQKQYHQETVEGKSAVLERMLEGHRQIYSTDPPQPVAPLSDVTGGWNYGAPSNFFSQ